MTYIRSSGRVSSRGLPNIFSASPWCRHENASGRDAASGRPARQAATPSITARPGAGPMAISSSMTPMPPRMPSMLSNGNGFRRSSARNSPANAPQPACASDHCHPGEIARHFVDYDPAVVLDRDEVFPRHHQHPGAGNHHRLCQREEGNERTGSQDDRQRQNARDSEPGSQWFDQAHPEPAPDHDLCLDERIPLRQIR